MNPSQIVTCCNSSSPEPGGSRCTNDWKNIVTRYEERNASLEHRQAQLSERLCAMECALPSILMSAMVSMHYGTEPPKMDLESVLSKSGVNSSSRHTGSEKTAMNADSVQVELVYKRANDSDPDDETHGKTVTRSSRFATGDDGRLNQEIGPGDHNMNEMSFAKEPESTDSAMNMSVMSSQDLIALGRIQELAEQERSLKRYIWDLESRERTFCETLERANRLLNDPLECVQECVSICPGGEAKEPLSDDPVMLRLQKLEFYNKKMITSMMGLRQEKNLLLKQTELLKTQLRNTQEKLGEVQKEVLGEEEMIPVMGDASFMDVRQTCSCNSTTNKENASEKPKTLLDLAEQFENVLQKAKNHGLCKLSGTIKDTAMKLKELSKSEETYKCICDSGSKQYYRSSLESLGFETSHSVNQNRSQDAPCPNCKCGKFDIEKFGETGDWFCDSCGGECVCDLVSLDEDQPKSCECGCQEDAIACECGCGISNANEIGEAGDIPKAIARKLSEDLKDVVCKDCGNCKCGDDHSSCPNCIEACKCSCINDSVQKSLLNTEIRPDQKERELRDPGECGPRCACSDSDDVWGLESEMVKELRKKFVFSSGKRGNPDLHPCFECEKLKPCDICFEEELGRLEQPKNTVRFGLQEPLTLEPLPCEKCQVFGSTSKEYSAKVNPMCDLCRSRESTTSQAGKTEIGKSGDLGNGDKTESPKIHGPNCPCGCNATVSLSEDECLCGCGVNVKVLEKENESCPCGCDQIVRLSNVSEESGCDCECAKGGVHCEYCCCVESIVELLNADKAAHSKSPRTCPCIEDSIRETEMDLLAKTLEKDIDEIGKKNNILRQLVTRCASSLPEIIQDPRLTDGCPYHDPMPIRPTISGLQTAIELLRVKSRSKDGMIAVLVENLRGKVDAGEIIAELATSKLAEISQDFDQSKLWNYLRRSEPGQNAISNCHEQQQHEIAKKHQAPCRYAAEIKNPGSLSAVPPPRDFKVINQICNDCLLVGWTPPNDFAMLNGYEILVDGYVSSRVGSPTRREALLISLDTSRPVMLTLYSVGPRGSLSEPVRITYPVCPCLEDS